jgi:regulator of nonsense transcripts 2
VTTANGDGSISADAQQKATSTNVVVVNEDVELIEKDIRDRFKKMCEGYFDSVSKILLKDHVVGINPFGGIEGGH